MAKKVLGIGSKVLHPKFGDGVVLDVKLDAYVIFFKAVGEKTLAMDYDGLEVIELREGGGSNTPLTMEIIENALENVIQKFLDKPEYIPLGNKWIGGTMILKPSDESLQPKEVPIDTFFHKIVMVRDRLRVLEQNINSHQTLTDEEKVNLQQYITRIYGSLTTFNVLFRDKEDHFKGEGRK